MCCFQDDNTKGLFNRFQHCFCIAWNALLYAFQIICFLTFRFMKVSVIDGTGSIFFRGYLVFNNAPDDMNPFSTFVNKGLQASSPSLQCILICCHIGWHWHNVRCFLICEHLLKRWRVKATIHQI